MPYLLFLLSLLAGAPLVGARAHAQSSPPNLESEITQLNRMLAQPVSPSHTGLQALVDKRVDFEHLVQRTFGNYLERTLNTYEKLLSADELRQLNKIYHTRLQAACRRRLVADLEAALDGVKQLRLQGHGSGGGVDTLYLEAVRQDGEQVLGLLFQLSADGWKIVDAQAAGTLFSQALRHSCKEVLDKDYSLPVLTARLENREYIVLDDFSTTAPGELPLDWGAWRDKDQRKPLLYRVRAAGTNHFLAARDTGHSVILGKFIHWNPRDYPIMTWCWRANSLPPGGNELLDDSNDSAAGIYVVFSQNWFGVPKQIKYVWSTTLPQGTVGRRNKLFRPWFFVLESGDESLGRWTFEVVDLYADHQQKLGGKPAERTVGLGILTDANSTGSYAEAYYADLRVWPRAAWEAGRIENYCGCFADSTTPADVERQQASASD